MSIANMQIWWRIHGLDHLGLVVLGVMLVRLMMVDVGVDKEADDVAK